jgi:hypothetical protein
MSYHLPISFVYNEPLRRKLINLQFEPHVKKGLCLTGEPKRNLQGNIYCRSPVLNLASISRDIHMNGHTYTTSPSFIHFMRRTDRLYCRAFNFACTHSQLRYFCVENSETSCFRSHFVYIHMKLLWLFSHVLLVFIAFAEWGWECVPVLVQKIWLQC